jgi:uncharacterized protein (DUF2141 family)
MRPKFPVIRCLFILIFLLNVIWVPGSIGIDPVLAASPNQNSQNTNQNILPQSNDSMQSLIRQAEYQYTWHEPSRAYSAANRAQGWHTNLGVDGLQLIPGFGLESTSWEWQLRLSAWGNSEGMKQLNNTPAVNAQQNQVTYFWQPGLTEWYHNTNLGLEQGFLIDRLASNTTADLVLQFNLKTNLIPDFSSENQTIRFREPNGLFALKYANLKVIDAAGNSLPSGISLDRCLSNGKVNQCSLQIHVDTNNAVFPIVIDPLITTEMMQLYPSDGASEDWFGYAVAAGDDTVVVGAYQADIAGNANQGAVYVFSRNQGGTDSWGQVTKITASDGGANDLFGYAVAIDDEKIVVGASANPASGSNQGAAYVFYRNQGGANNWGQVAKLIASDASSGMGFGRSVTIEGDQIAVGAPAVNAAYVFQRNQGGGDAWDQVDKVTPSDGSSNFGISVALSGDTLAVGADLAKKTFVFYQNLGGFNNWGEVKIVTPSGSTSGDGFGNSVSISDDRLLVGALDATVGANTYQGAAFLFERNQTGSDQWGQVAQFVASDGIADDRFGSSVSISDDIAIVGGQLTDAAYVFDRNYGGANSWGQIIRLATSADVLDDNYGTAVSIYRKTVIVGAYGDDPGSILDVGTAYVYQRSGSFWQLPTNNLPQNGQAGDHYGQSLSINNDVLAVGAPGSDVSSQNDAGAVYILYRNQGGAEEWGIATKITAPDALVGDQFGWSVSIRNNVLVVGSNMADPGGNLDQGAVYVFYRNQGGANAWGFVKKLTGSDSLSGDNFGYSVAVDGQNILVGASTADVSSNADQGAAYVFARNAGGADNWDQVAKLIDASGEANDRLGYSVSLSYDTALVGACYSLESAPEDQSTAFIFSENVTGSAAWGMVKELTAPAPEAEDTFGCAVSVDLDKAVVGAPGTLVGGNTNQGEAFMFYRNQGGSDQWGSIANITASSGFMDDRFGTAVALRGDMLVIGAPGRSLGKVNQGMVFLRMRNEGGADAWGQTLYKSVTPANDGDNFGLAVAVESATFAAGAPNANPATRDNLGQAYVYWLDEYYTLTVTKSGTGTGTVFSTGDDPDIDCGDFCDADFEYGTLVTLTATPDEGSEFAGWSDNCISTGTYTCEIYMDANYEVFAYFSGGLELTLAKSGTGSGLVTSIPPGIDCGLDCTEIFTTTTVVTLTATADFGSTFAGFSGDCTSLGPDTCQATVDAPKLVTATFDLIPYTLTVSKAGTGDGNVTSLPTGINCGSDCSEDFGYGTVVTLTATPATGSTFSGWSTNCTVTGTNTCQVTIDNAYDVLATFTIESYLLTVSKSGDGGGTVTSLPTGIDCGSDCSETYDYGTVVTLTAAPDIGSSFNGWSGNCTVTGTYTCQTTVDQAKTVTATFTLLFQLTVTKSGSGSGSVTSSPLGIDCGADCTEVYTSGTLITLTAAPSTGTTFSGWSSNCSSTGSFTCQVTMDATKEVIATFTINTYLLAVVKSGTGDGTVTSSPTGINCGPDCSEVFDYGTLVTLTASPVAGSASAGWSANCTPSGANTCQITVTAADQVVATFNAGAYTLTVNKSGTGSGTVNSSPPGIDCGSDCSEAYTSGTLVTLTATPATGSTFSGWSANCTVTGTYTCQVTMDTARTVTATFTLNTYTLTVSKSGDGSGTVTSSPVGIDCGSDCSEIYSHGSLVTLTASPAAGSTFISWSANCTVTGTFTCEVTVDQAKTVTATFNSLYQLTVSKSGTGSGNVTSSPPGIDCGSDCSEQYASGTLVTLTATPAAGSSFTGWSANCTITGGNACQVTMDTARTVTATFTLNTYLLAVVKSGNGSGTVTSSPGGIDCGNDCSESFNFGTVVILTATPGPGAYLVGWSSECVVTGTYTCQVQIDSSKQVTATFATLYMYLPFITK